MSNYDQVLWLNVTNFILGLVTLACVLVIGFAGIRELRQRAKGKVEADDHAFSTDGLGMTMADGGRRVRSDEMIEVTEEAPGEMPKKKSTHEKESAD